MDLKFSSNFWTKFSQYHNHDSLASQWWLCASHCWLFSLMFSRSSSAINCHIILGFTWNTDCVSVSVSPNLFYLTLSDFHFLNENALAGPYSFSGINIPT